MRLRADNRGFHLMAGENARGVERFTPSGADELFYEFAVEDPDIYTRPWRGGGKGRLAAEVSAPAHTARSALEKD